MNENLWAYCYHISFKICVAYSMRLLRVCVSACTTFVHSNTHTHTHTDRIIEISVSRIMLMSCWPASVFWILSTRDRVDLSYGFYCKPCIIFSGGFDSISSRPNPEYAGRQTFIVCHCYALLHSHMLARTHTHTNH